MTNRLPRTSGWLWAAALLAGLACPYGTVSFAADDEIITGAGAHFSWVVFDHLKDELESRTGRKLVLYGKESMLGAGCNAGIKSATLNKSGSESFGFVCCPLTDEEITKYDLRVFPLALEPILITVNQANPVDNLSIDQVRAVFRGDITNWKELGGRDQPIVVITRLHCKKRPGHWKTILPSVNDFSDRRLNVMSAAENVNRVSDFSGAIGHVGSAWPLSDKVRVIRINGYEPNADNIRSGNYPFHRRLAAVTNQHPSDDMLILLQEAQKLIADSEIARRYHLVPLLQP